MGFVRGSIIIARPVGEVFDFVADERNEPTYNPRMVRVRKVTPGPVQAGTVWSATILDGRGRATDVEVEITGFDRPRRLESVTRTDPVEISGGLTFVAIPSGTRMEWDWRLRAKGAWRLLSPILTLVGRRQEGRIWLGLKRCLEGE